MPPCICSPGSSRGSFQSIISIDEFYAAFCEYCREKRPPIISKSVVGRRLPQLLRVENYRPKVGGVRITAWKGIRLKKQVQEEQ